MHSPPTATKTNSTHTPETARTDDHQGKKVRSAFDDVALLMGGAAVIHQFPDDLTWTLMKRLDRIRVRLLRELKGNSQRDEFEPSVAQPPRVHAAVEEFLVRNRQGMGE